MQKIFKDNNFYRLALIIIYGLALFSTIYLFTLSREMQIESYGMKQQDIISYFINNFSSTIEHKIHDLELLAVTQAAKNNDFDTLTQDILETQDHSGLYTINLIDKEGTIKFSSNSCNIDYNNINSIQLEGHSVVNQVADVIKEGATQVSPIITLMTDEKGIIIISPIYNGDIYQGSLMGVLTLDKLNQGLFMNSHINESDAIIGIDPSGDYIFGPAKLQGKNFRDFVNENDNGYKNYFEMIQGKTNTTKHYFPVHLNDLKSAVKAEKEIIKLITYAPVNVLGQYLCSVAVVTPYKDILKINIPYGINIILLIIGAIISAIGFFHYNKVSSENLVKEAIIQETETRLQIEQKLNIELAEKKESYEALWEETTALNTKLEEKNKELTEQKGIYELLWEKTSVLNNELVEKNKQLVEQKGSYEALWEETTALNEELLINNSELVKLNNQIDIAKNKLLILNSIGEKMVSSSNISLVLTDIMKMFKKILNFSTSRIRIWNSETNELELFFVYGYTRNKNQKNTFTLDEGLTGYAAKNKEIVIVNDVSKDSRYIMQFPDTKSEVVIPLLVKDVLVGVIDFQHNEPIVSEEDHDEVMLLKALGNNVAMVLKNSQLYEQLKNAYLDIVRVLVKAIEAKDLYTSGHCERVREIAKKIAVYMELEKSDIEILELSALLHDIGKIGIPESILNNKGKLTEREYNIIKNHPLVGFEMLKDIPFLKRINRIILQHHERIDGKGYPNSLNSEQIDKLAKILNVADSIDAMLSNRPYRSANNLEFVIGELEKCAGTQFDRDVAEAGKMILIIENKIEKLNNNELGAS